MTQPIRPSRIVLEAAGIFVGAVAMLFTLAPNAPFTKELGVCESGAARDVLAGNILLPHFIPGPIVHVPPLYWWIAAVCVHLLGWTELAFRLPALVPAALTCAIAYAWAASRLGRETALWSTVALFFGHFFLDAARQPRMDALLAMFVTAAVASLECAIVTRRRAWFAAAALAIGLGCLTKGILGIALPGCVIAFYLIVRGRFTQLFRLDLMAAFTVGLAIGLAWYVAGYEIAGSKFLQWQIGMNLWSRFIPAEAGGANYCVHPLWYFVPQIAGGLLPWSLYVPVLAIVLGARWRSKLPEPVIYALCWFAAIFIFFSLSRGKCQVYILPAFPPLALLIGWVIAEVCADTVQPLQVSRLFGLGSFAVALGAAVIVAAALVVMTRGVPARLTITLHPTDRRFLEIFEALAATRHYGLLNWLVLSTLGTLIILLGVWRGTPGLQAFGVLIIAVAGSRFWFGVMNPALADRETLKLFAHEIMDVVPADARIGHIGIEDCDIYFYSPRPIEPVFRFQCGGQFPPYLVIRKERFDALPAAQRACLTPILSSDAVDSNGPRLLVHQAQPQQ
jgi:4-amino-4-deoxy-L-arabinose transferase-like glycosyltransferase